MVSASSKITFTAGQTFLDQVGWFQGERVYSEIDTIETGLPTRIRSVSHGIPLDLVTPVWFENFITTKQIFKSSVQYFAFAIDENIVEIIDLNSEDAQISRYGTMWYIPPFDLTSFYVRTNFRKTPTSPTLLSLSSSGDSPAFSISNPGLVRLELTPAHTRLLSGFSKSPVSGVAQVEAVNNDTGQIFGMWNYEWTVLPNGENV